jgi:anaerobic selenocysteine-containing dehydrogenase
MALTACPLDCPDTCSLEVTVTDGRIVSIDAGPGNPLTQGFICQKVKHHAQRVYAPERVLTPLVRTGPKGAGEFRAASWDDALSLVVDRLRETLDDHGGSAVIPVLYNSSAGVLASAALGDRLWRRMGAAEVHHTVCAATAGQAWDDTYGRMLSADVADVVHARLIVVWGANPTVSNTHLPPLVNAARRAGARLVVVDPRRTGMAARADRHVRVRPGTDVVLALAMARHLNEVDLVDRAFAADHVDGLAEYLAAADEWTLDRAAAVCGVAAADIAAFAEEYATTRPALVRIGWGIERNRNGGSSYRAVLALPLLAGQFGELGGGVMASLTAAPISMRRADPDRDERHPPRRDVNMNHLGRVLNNEDDEQPPAHFLYVQGANPAATFPNQRYVLAGLARDDLFTVVHDQVLTDTARYADVVLPATTHFEADDIAASYGSFTLQRMRPVIDRVGESKTNDELSAAIAERLGFPAASFDADPDRLIDAVVKLEAPFEGAVVVRPDGGTVQFRDTFPTPDGRARLFLADSELPLPRYCPLDDQYPLTLLSPATSRTINSMFGEFNGPAAAVSLHPDDAESRGLSAGDMVVVFNDRAEVEMPVLLDGDLLPGICSIPKGLWRHSSPSGLTANALVPDDLSDLAGGACFNDARVEVRRGRGTTSA